MRMLTSLLMVAATALAFNVDIPSASTYRGPSGSYFGFSVDLHKDRGVNWVLVGAPTAQTPQPGVSRGGSVFRCDTSNPANDNCQAIPFDVTGNNNASGQQIDQKSEQWFGATVRSSGPNGAIVACAPRYVWYSSNYKKREPVGTCFVARDSFRKFSEYSPCRTSNWGYHRQGSCQAGLSASITPDGNRMFVGAVGSWYWQGQLYSINTTFPSARSPVFRTFITGQLFSQGLFSRLDVQSTSEGSAAEDDSYMGYSSAVGDLDGDGQSDVAVGMPRGANLTGKVVMFTSNLTNIKNVTGDQLGAYFGYCVTVSDVNGDGLDDLIIGAPLYTNYANTEGKFETGRVHIVYQSERDSFQSTTVLDGDVTKARFGLSVAALGDINLDGYNDIVVGAPYDGPNERGAVHIFHGSAEGIKVKATQVVFAEEVSINLKTFGFSVAGGLDVDGNEYPDVVVGAYGSDNAVYFKSRPVVYVNPVEIRYDLETKEIDLENRNCTLFDATAVACVPLTLCFQYSGRGVDNRQEVQVQLNLDAKNSKNPRLHFLSSEGRSSMNQTFSLTKGSLTCRTHIVYMRPLIRDKLTPIEAEVRYSLKEVSEAQRRRNPRSLPPVIGTTTPTKSDFLNIQKNCGRDNICVPDMQLTAQTNMEQYILGSGERMEIQVTVLNAAEDAFEATVYLFLPPTVSFINIERGDESDTFILCSPPAPGGNNVLRCDVGNPLPAFKSAVFTIRMEPNALIINENAKTASSGGIKLDSSLEFVLEVNSTNPEEGDKLGDNILEISLPVRVETDLFILGVSDPDVVRFNLSAFTSLQNKTHESHIGPQVTHVYELGNKGPSDILQADVYILWPTKTLSGKDLLYLVDLPIIDGPATCQPMNSFNPLALKLESETSTGRFNQGRAGSSSGRRASYSSRTFSSPGPSSSSDYSSSSGSLASSGSSTSSSGSSSSDNGSGSSSATYRYASRSGAGRGSDGNSLDGSVSRSSWNRTSTVTRYNPDGTIDTKVTNSYSEPVSGRRNRRQSTDETPLQRELSACGANQCTVIKCKTAPITTNSRIVFKMRSRIWVQTISEIDWMDLSISSKMVVDIKELPYGVKPDPETSVKTALVTTTLDQLDREQEARAIPWWVIILSAVAGVLLLLLLIFVLWKLGFFERKRPDQDDMETEPLKSENGHLQRDEAL